MAFTRVAGFLPSQQGFHFSNYWPGGTPYPFIALPPPFGTIVTGDAGNGLCGGFVLATLDLFRHNPRLAPPPDTAEPILGSPIYNYLYQRLIDSIGDPTHNFNAAKVVEWIHTSDADIPGFTGLASRIVQLEWPRIKADIDAGIPSPLNLVGGPMRGQVDITGHVETLRHCHNVLAYAYELDSAQKLAILVYDCNDPTNDDSRIILNISNPLQPLSITAPAVNANMALGIDVRGFFRTEYDLRDPSSILPGAVSSWANLGRPQGANIFAPVGAVTVSDTPASSQRSHVFVLGNDGYLWCLWWSGSAWSWLNMGKPQSANIRGLMGVVAVRDTPTSPERPHVFVEGDDSNLWCRYSTGAAWNWVNVGKPTNAKLRFTMGAVTVMDTPTSAQRAHLFVECDDYNLWCLYWTGSAWKWVPLSKPQGVNIKGSVGAVTVMDTPTSPQRGHVFVTGSDGKLWCLWSNGAAWNWLNMDSPSSANIRGLMGVVAVRDTPTSPQRAHVFVECNDSNLWCCYSTGAAWNWVSLGKPPQGVNIRAAMGAVSVKDTPTSAERPHLFVEGNDYNLWCLRVTGAAWGWVNLGKPQAANITGSVGAVTVMEAPTLPQIPRAFVTGSDGNLWLGDFRPG